MGCVFGVHLVISIYYIDFSFLKTYVSYVKFSKLFNGISYIAIRQVSRELSKNLWHDLIALVSTGILGKNGRVDMIAAFMSLMLKEHEHKNIRTLCKKLHWI